MVSDPLSEANRKILLKFQWVLMLLRWLFFPFITYLLPLLSTSIRKRLDFECQNAKDPLSRSWPGNIKADVAFEVSSEGEFEQAFPLIKVSLERNQRVEVFYASESLEKKIQNIAKKLGRDDREKIRFIRMPLLTSFPFPLGKGQSFFQLVTAKKLILCRYDFYPELLIYGAKEEVDFVLLNATLKGKEDLLRREGTLKYLLYQSIYSLFDFFLTATLRDLELFKKLGIKEDRMLPFDLRVLQIQDRILGAEESLSVFPGMAFLNKVFKKIPIKDRLLMGSCWPLEMESLKDESLQKKLLDKSQLVVLAPHKLSKLSLKELEGSYNNFCESLPHCSPMTFLDLRDEKQDWESFFEDWEKNPGPIVLTTPGILLETYTFFGSAFVGGGHGRSIHSVLEPFLAGCRVYCGPKTHRSTEFDLVLDISPSSIFLVHELRMFATILNKKPDVPDQSDDRTLHSNENEESKSFMILMGKRFLTILDFLGMGKEEKC